MRVYFGEKGLASFFLQNKCFNYDIIIKMDTERFFELLCEVCDELPDEFFRDLHQGVVLSEKIKLSPYGLIILGEYRRSYFGNQITIYYGSFERLHIDEDGIKQKLREVVRHEFRHHVENLAGKYGRDSLEYEDKVNLQRYLRGE